MAMANRLNWKGFGALVLLGLTAVTGCGSEADDPVMTTATSGTPTAVTGTTTGGSTTSGGATVAGATTGASTTAAAGAGVLVDGTCRLACVDGSSDDDGDGWGFEGGQSCIVPGGAVDTAVACSDAVLETGPDSPSTPGSGVLVGGNCTLVCLDDTSDADDAGATDGWGWERGQSCLVPGGTSDPGAGNECTLELMDSAPGGMVDVGGTCTAVCVDASSDPDGDGWGYDDASMASCVVPGGRADTGVACSD
jgi:hypothetical protein